jgi:hypothetical protein
MFWTSGFYKTQFCKWIMLSCVIKFEICESILFTHLKFVFGFMLYNDDGFLINIRYIDHLQFYTSTAYLFFIFLNYGILDLSLIIYSNKCSHIIGRHQIMKIINKHSFKATFFNANFIMVNDQCSFCTCCFGGFFFWALPIKARILCWDSL